MVGNSLTDAILVVSWVRYGREGKKGKEDTDSTDKKQRGTGGYSLCPELNNYWKYISTRPVLLVSALADTSYRLAIQGGVIIPWGGGSSA